nr:hypothetical protein [Pantoea rodasii]
MQESRHGGGIQLTLMEGNGDRRSDRNTAEPEVLSAVHSTVNTMAEHGLDARYQLFPGLTHGQMFGASLADALTQISITP